MTLGKRQEVLAGSLQRVTLRRDDRERQNDSAASFCRGLKEIDSHHHPKSLQYFRLLRLDLKTHNKMTEIQE